jgi:hypothetical protein
MFPPTATLSHFFLEILPVFGDLRPLFHVSPGFRGDVRAIGQHFYGKVCHSNQFQ